MLTYLLEIARRDDHLRPAQWETRDVLPLPPQEIRRWIDTLGPHYNEHQRRHFEEVWAGIDGRAVEPDEQMNPSQSIRLRSPGSVADARDILLSKRVVGLGGECGPKQPCVHGARCIIPDRLTKGVCYQPTPTIEVTHHG